MPPKLGNLKPRQIVKALLKGSFYVHETTGSHVQLKHRSTPGRVTVPYHAAFTVPPHVVKSIIRQAGLSNKELFELLER